MMNRPVPSVLNLDPHETTHATLKREALKELHTCNIGAVYLPMELVNAVRSRVVNLLRFKDKP
jgi:hypothetical protein